MNYALKLSKKLSFGEEIANAVTHAVGAVLMLILLPISAIYSYEGHGLVAAVGTSIFVISLFLMFLSSTHLHFKYPFVLFSLQLSTIQCPMAQPISISCALSITL